MNFILLGAYYWWEKTQKQTSCGNALPVNSKRCYLLTIWLHIIWLHQTSTLCCPKLLLSWNTIMFQREREGGGSWNGSGWESWYFTRHRRDWHSILRHQKHYEQVQDGRMCHWAPGLPLMLRPITDNVSPVNKDDGQGKTGKRLNKNVLLIYLITLWLLRGHYDVRSCTVRGNIYSPKRLLWGLFF